MQKTIIKTAICGSIGLALTTTTGMAATDMPCPAPTGENTVTLCLTSLPDNHPVTDPVYLAGTPNGWNAGDKEGRQVLQFTRHANGAYSLPLVFEERDQIHQFKLTRGTWGKVELDSEGYDVPNRNFQYRGKPQIVELHVGKWADLEGGTKGRKPTLVGDLHLHGFTFPINDGERQVRVWLPKDYNANRAQPYPVIYAWDGQNLFDERSASYGMEWQIDEALTELAEDYVVIGLDSPDERDDQDQDRITRRYIEYSAFDWVHPDAGPIAARGKETVDFLVDTVIPLMETNYNIADQADGRHLLGSSMGGYMGLFAASYRPEAFGGVIAFSHATNDHYGGEQLRAFIEAQGQPKATIYLDMGDQETVSVGGPDVMLQGHSAMIATLEKVDANFSHAVIEGGVHDESAWAARFADVLKSQTR